MQSVRNIRSSDNARTNSFKTGSSNQKVENAGPRRNDGAIQNARSAKREASANRKVETSHESSDSRGGGFR
ncbi:hypothetical protein [Halpernia sp. GG3]